MPTARRIPRCPRIGPYATVTYDEPARKWRVRLNAEGQQVVVNFLEQYRRLTNLMLRIAPRVLAFVRMNGFTEEEIEVELQRAVVVAVTRWDPNQISKYTGEPVRLSTVASWWIRNAGTTLARQAGQRVTERQFASVFGQPFSVESAIIPDRRHVDPDAAIDIRRVMDALEDPAKTAVAMRYGIGYREHALDEIAVRFDMTREGIRQLIVRALLRCRHLLDHAAPKPTINRFVPTTVFTDVREALTVGDHSVANLVDRTGHTRYNVQEALKNMNRNGQVEAIVKRCGHSTRTVWRLVA